MTLDEFRDAGIELYGKWGWQTRLAEKLGVDSSTVRRWSSGAISIPGPVEAAIKCFIDRKRNVDKDPI